MTHIGSPCDCLKDISAWQVPGGEIQSISSQLLWQWHRLF